MALYATPALAAFPGTNGQIAYSTHGDFPDEPQLGLMGADGSNAREPGPGGFEATVSPAWSPNGAKLAYVQLNAPTGDATSGDVFTLNGDGGCVSRITNDGFTKESVAWAPDGARLVYVRSGMTSGGGSVPDPGTYTVNADGSGATRIRTSGSDPVWSPDGSKIAFVGSDGDSEIYAMDADGTDAVQLTSNSASDGHPNWSPDGTKIAFDSNRNGNGEIYVMDADGTDPVRLTTNTVSDSEPAWSPDGTRIAFTTNRVGWNEVYGMDADGTDQARLSPASDGAPPYVAFEPDWQPLTGANTHRCPTAGATRTQIDNVPGVIADVAPDRILYLEGSGADAVLKVKDRATSQVTTIPSVAPRYPTAYAFLTSHGALFAVAGDQVSDSHVYEWRDGAILDHGRYNAQILVEGDFAIWTFGSSLYRRDLSTGTTVLISTTSGNTENDLAPNGDVAYWSCCTSADYDIHRYRNGIDQQLTNDASLWNTYPITDGINVVYRKVSPCCGAESGRVALYTEGGEAVLDSFRNSWPSRGSDYDASGGYVAYTRIETGSARRQVWLRDPSGGETQVTANGVDARIVAMNELGEVFYSAGGTLFLAKPGIPAIDFGPNRSEPFWQEGFWYQTEAGILYRLDPNVYPRPGGGTPLRVPLVPAFRICGGPFVNATHAAPLDFDSCSPPRNNSTLLTTGSDGKMTAFARFIVQPGDLTTAADEADVGVAFSARDVRNASDGSDYTGQVMLTASTQITDRSNGPSEAVAATVEGLRLAFPVDCASTSDNTVGATCNLNTTWDTLMPGFGKEGRRAIVTTTAIKAYDAGPDGNIGAGGPTCPPTCGTGDERVFLDQGLFLP